MAALIAERHPITARAGERAAPSTGRSRGPGSGLGAASCDRVALWGSQPPAPTAPAIPRQRTAPSRTATTPTFTLVRVNGCSLMGTSGGSYERLRNRCAGTGEATYWDIEDIQFHCRLSRTTAWRLARHDAGFPIPVILGPRNFVWPRAEVVAFLEARRRAAPQGKKPTRTSRVPNEQAAAYSPRPLRSRPGR